MQERATASTDTPEGTRPATSSRASWLAWVFIALAIYDLVSYVDGAGVLVDPTPGDVLVHVVRVIPGIVALLLPAALLFRHADAPRRLPTVLFGMILGAAAQVLVILADPLAPLLESLAPATEELPWLVPLSAGYLALVALISALGLAYIAIGLTQARRFEDSPAPALAAVVPVAAVLATVVGILSAARVDYGAPMSPMIAVYLVISVGLGILRVVVWAYLAVGAARGWLAGEDPPPGWWLALLAAVFVLVALAMINLRGLFDVTDLTVDETFGYLVASAYAIGNAFLLAAFAVGLPALDPLPATEPDDDERRGGA